MFLFRTAWSDWLQQAISIQPTPFPWRQGCAAIQFRERKNIQLDLAFS